MLSSARAFKDEHAEAYVQVAGDLILKGTAKATVSLDPVFETDISEQYGWLFEPAFLRHDDWQPVDFTLKVGRTTRSWARPSDWSRSLRRPRGELAVKGPQSLGTVAQGDPDAKYSNRMGTAIRGWHWSRPRIRRSTSGSLEELSVFGAWAQ